MENNIYSISHHVLVWILHCMAGYKWLSCHLWSIISCYHAHSYGSVWHLLPTSRPVGTCGNLTTPSSPKCTALYFNPYHNLLPNPNPNTWLIRTMDKPLWYEVSWKPTHQRHTQFSPICQSHHPITIPAHNLHSGWAELLFIIWLFLSSLLTLSKLQKLYL